MNSTSCEREISALLGENAASRILHESLSLPDGQIYLLNVLRVSEALGAEKALDLICGDKYIKLLLPLLSCSQFLTDIIVSRPILLDWLLTEGNYRQSIDLPSLMEETLDMVARVTEEAEMSRLLRLVRNREILRIGLRDLARLSGMAETGQALSDLAEATVTGATAFALSHMEKRFGVPLTCDEGGEEMECPFTVLALGKFGGRELNFSSDIDIMYVYDSDRLTFDREEMRIASEKRVTSLHQHFIKVSEMITKLIGDVTEDGVVFRVDLRLRPDGSRGPLANSLRALETYYESWGHTWERGALIKARPVAGDHSLGERVLNALTPFVYRKYLDFIAIEEVKKLKEKIDISLKIRREGRWDVKLGQGGIREIEFFIQSHQLIFGGKNPAIREGNSLKALSVLREEGYVSTGEEEALSRAYRFLRDLEHRIQMLSGRQTQELPAGEDLTKVAFMLGFENVESFQMELEKQKRRVRSTFNKLFVSKDDEDEDEISPNVISVLYGDMEEESVHDLLVNMGFSEPEKAAKDIEMLRSGPQFSRLTESGRGYLRKIAPHVLWKALHTPDPDMAISNIERFINSIGARTTLYALLSENRSVIEPLVQLFGSSQYLAGYFLNHPELMDILLRRGQSTIIKNKTEIRKELGEELVAADGLEEELDVMRRFRNEEFLRIGIHMLARSLSLEEFSFQLSALAEVTMGYALFLATREVAKKFGKPCIDEGRHGQREPSLAVLGMGKLGGEELNFHSDLDIIFIYSHMGETEKGMTNHEFFARVGQRFISNLQTVTREGYVYKVDMRLRPSGSAGPLVTSQDAFKKYYREDAWAWEKQALLKARFVAGERKFGKELEEWIKKFVYHLPMGDNMLEEIGKVRKRMETELGKEKDGFLNLKFGRGGLIDVEFLVQYLQLVHGREHPSLMTQNTLRALYELFSAGVIDDEEFHVLDEGYRFLRELEIGLRLVHDTSVERFQIDDRGVKLLNIGSLGEFRKKYEETTGKVREIYCRYMKI